jgi:eukaryotic-like serine/threonine-protein kinase
MLPERFGRYEVLAELGDGAMGRVYSAWDPKVSRVVAVKTVKSELLTSATADDYLKRFRREAVAAGALTHPQVVRVFDIGDDFLVMELVEGRTLFAMIREAGRIEPAETLRLLGPVAEALDHAHRAGIVHRDIKPANVIVQPDGQPKLMDFGVAHLAASVMTTAGQVLGSPSYMSPEQIAGATVTGRSDVYSLAVVAYEMLTGQSPFQGKSITQVIYRVMHEQPAPPRHWNAALPARYDDVFARALAKDP